MNEASANNANVTNVVYHFCITLNCGTCGAIAQLLCKSNKPKEEITKFVTGFVCPTCSGNSII